MSKETTTPRFILDESGARPIISDSKTGAQAIDPAAAEILVFIGNALAAEVEQIRRQLSKLGDTP